ncbi:MAG: hypothetical protein IKH96_07075 [Ruminococcus sp.]|uniref:ABC-three component system middle component 6 n=1 Tax=Ruminococcus sp. TaxID=41978 RepID=UPI0025CEC104|nr:ABC-three component system middle component 6 [Ruminococcus sp.]MBR6995768.1 hypothetical protein [Ruminococcus sp.]
MILPDKNIKLEYSLLNCGAIILMELIEPQTLSLLWDKVKKSKFIVSYEKYLLVLDYLYMIKAIELKDGLIVRCKK